MTKYFCDRCGKEVKQPVNITITLNDLITCVPNIFSNQIDHQFCQECWAYIRDKEMNKMRRN